MKTDQILYVRIQIHIQIFVDTDTISDMQITKFLAKKLIIKNNVVNHINWIDYMDISFLFPNIIFVYAY